MSTIRLLAGRRSGRFAAAALLSVLGWGCGSRSDPATPARAPSREQPVHASAAGRARWQDGGSLHYASMHEWRAAPYADRLATCGDFVAAALRGRGAPSGAQDMELVKQLAIDLEAKITEWASHVDWVLAFAAEEGGKPRYDLEELQAIAADPRRPVPQTAAALYVYRSRKKGRAATPSDLDASEVARTYLARMQVDR